MIVTMPAGHDDEGGMSGKSFTTPKSTIPKQKKMYFLTNKNLTK